MSADYLQNLSQFDVPFDFLGSNADASILNQTSSDKTFQQNSSSGRVMVPDGADTELKAIDVNQFIADGFANDDQLISMLLNDKDILSSFIPDNFDPSTMTALPTMPSDMLIDPLVASMMNSMPNGVIIPQNNMQVAQPSPVPAMNIPQLGADVEDPFAVLVPTHAIQPFMPVAQAPPMTIPAGPQLQFVSHQPKGSVVEANHLGASGQMSQSHTGGASRATKGQKRKMARQLSFTNGVDNGDNSDGDSADQNDSVPLNPEMKKLRRLEKNREAAQQFRQRQKSYISGLETQVQSLDAANKEMQERYNLIIGENMLLKEQLTYLRHFINKAVSFKGPGGELTGAPMLLPPPSSNPCGIASQ